ncbi:MAG: methylated-DNA--[protein]-cysteine S-methyltransferase [Candidatus Methylopumilus sp.]|nr:methylated-DNA--[protein]-cysteine S-methyltransferase [Candidatus Methylopumilus sp.]
MTYPALATINTGFGGIAIHQQAGLLKIDLLGNHISEPTLSQGTVDQDAVVQDPTAQHQSIKQMTQEILAYLQQPHQAFSLPAQLAGSAFQQKVWLAILAIPLGQTRTYSELAAQLQSGPRAVANACGANRLPLLIPCHRVVAKNGLGGFMRGDKNGLSIKRWLLAHEGVHVY